MDIKHSKPIKSIENDQDINTTENTQNAPCVQPATWRQGPKEKDAIEEIIPNKELIEAEPSENTLNSEISEPKYKNLVLSGGSIRGLSHVGALQRLIKEKLIDLKKLKAVAGTSAGALFAILIVLGFSIEEIWEFILCLDMKKMVKPDFWLFLKKCGVESGCIIHNLFEEILTKKTGTKHINFRQLYEKTKIHLTVVGSCLTTKETIYYDHINTPNFKVSMAIRISISMPGFFTPVTIDDKKYIDGSVLNNYAMNLFQDRLDETIGIRICNEYDTDYKCPEQYLMAVMNLFMYRHFDETSKKYSNNTVFVKDTVDSVFVFNFDLDNETKMKLYKCGITAAEEFIERTKLKAKIIEEDF